MSHGHLFQSNPIPWDMNPRRLPQEHPSSLQITSPTTPHSPRKPAPLPPSTPSRPSKSAPSTPRRERLSHSLSPRHLHRRTPASPGTSSNASGSGAPHLDEDGITVDQGLTSVRQFLVVYHASLSNIIVEALTSSRSFEDFLGALELGDNDVSERLRKEEKEFIWSLYRQA